MPEAVQDRPQVIDVHKAINVANSKSIADVTIKCGTYQGDALSPLLSCMALNLLSALLDKSAYGYRFKSGTTINHLYMDDIKLYAKNKQDID